MRGYIQPRALAAIVPELLPCNAFARLKAGTQLSLEIPRFICVTAGSVWEGATVAAVAADAPVCNRMGRKLQGADVLLDWRPFRDEADLFRLCPILVTLRERLPFSLVVGEEHFADQKTQFVGRLLATAARDFDALAGSRRPQAPPQMPVGFRELKVGADGALGSTRSAVKTYLERSKMLNPSLHRAANGSVLKGKRVQAVTRMLLEFLPDVNEVSADGNLVAEVQLAQDARPANVSAEELHKKPPLPPPVEAPDASLPLPDVKAAIERVDAKLSTARSAEAHALFERGREAADQLRAEVVKLCDQARRLSEPANSAGALSEVRRDEAARAAAPANMVVSPAATTGAAAPRAATTGAAPGTGADVIRWQCLQFSDVGTDVLFYANLSMLEKDVYAGKVSSVEEAEALLVQLAELRQIGFLGGGLHFIMHVVQMILSGHWDYAGLRQWKVAMGRTDFDPTKEAQQLRRKVEMIRAWVAGWFKAAIREFHDTWSDDSVFDFSHDSSAAYSEQSRLKSEAHTKAFLLWVEQGKATGDTEFRKHAVFVLDLAVPLLLYWEASRHCEYETMDVVEKYFLPHFEVCGKDKYLQTVGWLKLKPAQRDPLTNMIVATHITNSMNGVFGKLMHGDHFQEIHVNQQNQVVTLEPAPDKWADEMCVRSLNLNVAQVLTNQVATGSWSQLALGGGEGEHITSSRKLEVVITARMNHRLGIVRADPRRVDVFVDLLGSGLGAHVIEVKVAQSITSLLDQPLASYIAAGWPLVLRRGGDWLKGAAGGALAVSAKLKAGAFLIGCTLDADLSLRHGGGGEWHETKHHDGVGRGFLACAPAEPQPGTVDATALRATLGLAADGSGTAPPAIAALATTVLGALSLDLWKGMCGKTEVRLLQVSWAPLPAGQGGAAAAQAAAQAVLPAGALLTKVDRRTIDELWTQRAGGQTEQQFVQAQTKKVQYAVETLGEARRTHPRPHAPPHTAPRRTPISAPVTRRRGDGMRATRPCNASRSHAAQLPYQPSRPIAGARTASHRRGGLGRARPTRATAQRAGDGGRCRAGRAAPGATAVAAASRRRSASGGARRAAAREAVAPATAAVSVALGVAGRAAAVACLCDGVPEKRRPQRARPPEGGGGGRSARRCSR